MTCSYAAVEFKPPFQLTFYVVNPITKQWVVKEINVKTFISEMGEWSESVVLCPGDFGRRGVPYKNFLFWWDNSCGRLIWFDPYDRECYRLFEHPIKLDPYHTIECHGE